MLLQERLEKVRSQIHIAENNHGRLADSVLLLAVSKTRTADELISAYENHQRHFGENYLQEALNKQDLLKDYNIFWHFIGPIQSNKTRAIANRFSWVHSVDRIKIARRLSEQRDTELPALNICIQVNIDSQPTKAGVSVDELPELASAITDLPNLQLRGLMAIPATETTFENQRMPFRMLKKAQQTLEGNGYKSDTLSMGMSGDLEAAIAEGSTIVRIGTAIFGPRN